VLWVYVHVRFGYSDSNILKYPWLANIVHSRHLVEISLNFLLDILIPIWFPKHRGNACSLVVILLSSLWKCISLVASCHVTEDSVCILYGVVRCSVLEFFPCKGNPFANLQFLIDYTQPILTATSIDILHLQQRKVAVLSARKFVFILQCSWRTLYDV
jgi:hypothetical protein